MICPKCHTELDAAEGVCPECGVTLLRNVSGVMKTSAVMIATRGERGFYSSVKDVPEPLRTRLLETTASPNSGTIIIADKAGKEQLTQAMARRQSARHSGIDAPLAEKTGGVAPEPGRYASRNLPDLYQTRRLAWAGLVLVLLLAILAAAFFYARW